MASLRAITLLTLLLLAPMMAWAQGAVQQLGPVTPGHLGMWRSNGHIQDAGGPSAAGQSPVNGAAGTYASGLATVNSGMGNCTFSGSSASPYSRLCWGFDGSGNGLFSLDRVGGGTPPSWTFRLNDTNYPFPPTVPGNIARVANHAALRQTATTAFDYVTVAGTFTPGDGGGLTYRSSASGCSLNGGLGDNGSEIRPNDGVGCWLADFAGIRPSPIMWECAGDGVTADDNCLVAVAAWTSAQKATAYFPGKSIFYNAATPLTLTDNATWQGENGNQNVYSAQFGGCSSGLRTRANIDLLTVAGSTGNVDQLCFDMGENPGDRTAGNALTVGNAAIMTGAQNITRNTFINPYRGIDLGAATTGATQTNGSKLAFNVVINPIQEGIAVGRLGAGESTAGIALLYNQVACFATFNGTANPNARGIVVYDGAVSYQGGDVGPYGCHDGFVISPGIVGGNAQGVLGEFTGVLGDSSIAHDLLIDSTVSGSSAFYLRFSHAWASAVTTTDAPILIRNTGGGFARTNTIIFDALTTHGTLNNPNPLIEAQDDTLDLTIADSFICADGGGMDNVGIDVAAGVQRLTIVNSNFACYNGTLKKGIEIGAHAGPGAGIYIIKDNDFGGVPTPVDWAPNQETAVFGPNLGIDNAEGSVSAAATINLPLNQRIVISGSGTIDTANYMWSNARHTIRVAPGATWAFSAAGNICQAYTPTPGTNFDLVWQQASGCWARVGG